MPPRIRKPTRDLVPQEEAQRVLDEAVRQNGSLTGLAENFATEGLGPGRSWSRRKETWKRYFSRIRNTENVHGFDHEALEPVYLAAGERPPPPMYRQKVWRVSGFWPTGGNHGHNIKGDGQLYTTRHWMYITRFRAEYRVQKLVEQGLFIDWAMAEPDWKELNVDEAF